MKENAAHLCEIWNHILLNSPIIVCVDEMRGLGINDIKVLKLVRQKPNQSIKEYLDILKIPNSTFTNILNRLIKKGFLQRKMDEHDLRSYTVDLTSFGEQSVQKHLDEEEKLFGEFLGNLNKEEQETFLRLFSKLVSY